MYPYTVATTPFLASPLVHVCAQLEPLCHLSASFTLGCVFPLVRLSLLDACFNSCVFHCWMRVSTRSPWRVVSPQLSSTLCVWRDLWACDSEVGPCRLTPD
jgi:hypothetical protein